MRARKMRRVRPGAPTFKPSGLVVGIDPGKKGALVVLRPPGKIVAWCDCPVLPGGKNFDVREMADALPEGAWVFIERSQAMPGQGVVSMWSTGYSFGLWEGIVAARGLPYELVTPAVWQRQMYKGVKGGGKARSIVACRRLFPDLPVTGPKGGERDGRADAALIAVYGLRRLSGEGFVL